MARKISKINAPIAYVPPLRGTAPEVAPNDNGAPVFQSLAIAELEGEPRVRDLDLAERLGFERPRDIRKLIERNLPEIEGFGVCATVAQTSGPRGGRPTKEFYLNEEQALLVGVLSNTSVARQVRALVIKTFSAHRKSLAGEMMADSLPALVERLVTQRLEVDPRVAVLDYRLPIEILKSAGVPPKGRRGFSNTVRGKLHRFCSDRKIPYRHSPETDRQMFHVDAVNAWLKLEGNLLIAERMNEFDRQGVLKLVRS